MTNDEMAYVCREAECGCVTILMVDVPVAARENAKEIAAAIRRGMTVERMTVDAARPLFHRCEHRATKTGKRQVERLL